MNNKVPAGSTVAVHTIALLRRGRVRRLWLPLLLVLTLPLSARTHDWTVDELKAGAAFHAAGRRPDHLFSTAYLHLLAGDTQDILTAPLHWHGQDWLLAGGLTGLVAGTSILDGNTRTEAQEGRTTELDQFTKQAQRFGSTYSFVVLGGFEAYGWWAGDPTAQAVAMDGITASAIAGGIVAPVLKYAVGRVRPNTAARTFEFKPFSGNQSFPSGHTTQAFAVASVIAEHYDRWWEQGIAYGLAGVVGYSRIEQNAHFTSDVMAGAIIGTVIGRAVVHRHNQPRAEGVALAPFSNGQTSGLVLSRNF